MSGKGTTHGERPRQKMIARWCAAIAMVALALAPERRAAAQAPPKAEVLFQDGLEAMKAGDYATACPKLAESYRLDPLPGAGFTLAECEAGWGKVATALGHYTTFLEALSAMPHERRARFEERRRIAVDKLAMLTPLAPELTIDLSAGVSRDIVVKRDGLVVPPSSYGIGKKVDPGEHHLTAESGGALIWERRVTLGQRDRARVEVTPSSASSTARPGGSSLSTTAGGTRSWLYVAAGVGALGLTTGIVSGAVAWSQKSTIDENCTNRRCNAEGSSAVSTGQTAALVSSISFPIGIVGAVGAVLLYLKSRPKAASAWRGVRPGVLGADRAVAFTAEGAF